MFSNPFKILNVFRLIYVAGVVIDHCVVNPQIVSFHQYNYQSATALGNVYAGFSSKFITITYEKEKNYALSKGIALPYSQV